MSAWDALIFTNAFGCEVLASAVAFGEGEEEEDVIARHGGSCCGHTSPPLSSESLDRELEFGE